MKSPTKVLLCTAWLCVLAGSSCLAVDPTVQVKATIEIYEFPQQQALAWQKKYEEASEADRQKAVNDLRAEISSEIKNIAFGERICALNEQSNVGTVEEYRYPTMFETKDGFASPSVFEINNIGCTMTLKAISTEQNGSLFVELWIRDVALLLTQNYPASKADQPGSIKQPVFTVQRVETKLRLAPTVPKLVSVYSPYKGDATAHVLRLVFVTICPDR